MPRVLVVDDHRVFADALTMTLASEPEISCMPAAGSAEEALEVFAHHCPDVILLDVNLPGMSGVDAVPHLRRACPEARIVMLTGGIRNERLIEAIEGGVSGFLRKDQSLQDVVSLVCEAEERIIADAGDLRRLLHQPASPGSEPATHDGEPLTAREFAVLLLLADCVTVKQIARKLDITIHTCRGHVRSVLRKLGAHSQLEAVVIAARCGMLPNLRASSDYPASDDLDRSRGAC